ncbi:helix-turn-helix transcriptional regulator [Paenibacillus sp. FSL K6-3182]|uniref:helix-turn-helix domain-containing protein n=1 Tax=Paenibacillus sp. FSL K6-3182 TaxID=2921495 RepID=UPI0030D35FCA
MAEDKNPDLVKFGVILNQRRKELEITQDQLSLFTRIDRSYISEIENGLKNPSLTTILMLARALYLKPSELLIRFEEQIKYFNTDENK